ncbi:MAG TPA: amino acid adenylation domain-containing protein, partial [Gemmatimonadales bacterium]|nr:amino acid adenylation domain-containing protein [Gemmatimonadales bacterium]
MPVEPAYPAERTAFILRNARVKAVVTRRGLAGELPDFGGAVVLADGDELAREREDAPAVDVSPDHLAYVIHTSGSTGEPKGVAVRHRAAANLIHWVNTTFRIGPGDSLLFVTSPCFDLSVYDVFGILAAGACVRLASDEELSDPERLASLLRNPAITFWDSAPAALQQLAPYFAEGSTSLRLVFLSGDWVPLSLPAAVKGAFPSARLIALGGATEATIWSNFFPVETLQPRWTSVPYGRPIQNARYYVLDERLQPCPIGVPGDLFIAGPCLADGYANAPSLTADRFLPDPFSLAPGERMYRTGDRARFFADSNLEFLGRADQQVKIRGFRVELEEIEAQLCRHPALRTAAAAAKGDMRGERRLVAYVVPRDTEAPGPSELRAFLKDKLPEYMLPSAFVVLADLPLTPNGKLDRKALPEPGADRPDLSGDYAAPRSDTERTLCDLWASSLRLHRVGIHDNFFELGGDSIISLQIIARARQRGLRFTPKQLFQHQTVAELAPVTAEVRTEPEAEEAVRGPVPLSPIQRWFFERELPDPHHFNQAMMLEALEPLEPAALGRA